MVRVKELRESMGMSQRKAAEMLGVSLAAYQNYEYGKRDIPGNVLVRMAEVFGATSDYILGVDTTVVYSVEKKEHAALDERIGRMSGLKRAVGTGTVDVPLYGAIAAGTPLEMLEVEDSYPIPSQVCERYPGAFLLKVRGTSMDRIIPDGCYVLVDPSQTDVVPGKPYAVCVNGFDATVKLVEPLANGVRLVPCSTDPTHHAQTFDGADPDAESVTVIGRVVWYVLPFDWSF